MYMIDMLIIYINLNLLNNMNVTIYCYMYLLMLHVSIHVCNVAQSDRGIPPSVLTDTTAARLTTEARVQGNRWRSTWGLKGWTKCVLRSGDTGLIAPSVTLKRSMLYTAVYMDTEDCIITELLNFSIITAWTQLYKMLYYFYLLRFYINKY